jgi:membrane protease YdiL (CAAX protease family)
MLKRILLTWFVANFVIASLYAIITGGWYLRLPAYSAMTAELCLIILPNLLFPILLLRYGWTESVSNLRQALGWEWIGWRSILVGIIAFVIYLLLSTPLSRILGPSIPYNLPGQGNSLGGIPVILALLIFLAFVVITVMGEETMFRGLIQTQTSHSYRAWEGILLTVVLFGLRHLPADIFYAQVWNATPQMWLARLADLYLGAVLLSLARYFGRSTYASATMHFLIFMFILVEGFF